MEVNECLWCDLIQLRTSHHGKMKLNILMLLIHIYLFIFHFESYNEYIYLKNWIR